MNIKKIFLLLLLNFLPIVGMDLQKVEEKKNKLKNQYLEIRKKEIEKNIKNQLRISLVFLTCGISEIFYHIVYPTPELELPPKMWKKNKEKNIKLEYKNCKKRYKKLKKLRSKLPFRF